MQPADIEMLAPQEYSSKRILQMLAAMGAIMLGGCASTSCTDTDYTVSIPESVPFLGGDYGYVRNATCQPNDMTSHDVTQ
jgi:hypothetical protein